MHTIEWNEPSGTKSVKIKKCLIFIDRMLSQCLVPGPGYITFHNSKRKIELWWKRKLHSVASTMTRLAKTMITNCFGWMRKKFHSIDFIDCHKVFTLLSFVSAHNKLLSHSDTMFVLIFGLFKSLKALPKRERDKKERKRLNYKGTKTEHCDQFVCCIRSNKSKQNINNP